MTVTTGEGWTMTSGDCIAGMRDLADDSIDVTITDPPYEAEAHTKGKRQSRGVDRGEGRGEKYKRVTDQSFSFNAITEADRIAVGAQIARVTMKVAAVFCQVEAVHLWRAALEVGGMIYRRTIPWVKPDAMPSLHGKWPGQSFESLVICMKPGATAPIGGKARYYSSTRERGETRAHPTAKPLSLMCQIVEDFTEVGDLVLDGFAGSGTTGVAAGHLRRRFTGWEKLDGTIPVKDDEGVVTYPNYYDIACRRLRGEGGVVHASQLDLLSSLGGAA